jgi:putative hydrolase of the HAD superfamily
VTPGAIVFDLDDTLFAQRDFKVSGFRAVARWLAERRAVDETLALRAMHAALDRFGPSHPRLLDSALLDLDRPDVAVAELVEVFRQHRPSLDLFPGAKALLTSLRERYATGLLTDGLASVQRSKVEALDLVGLFDAILFSDDVGSCKPDPGLYEHFETVFGLSAGDLVYVADNPAKDFSAANARGWLTVRVLTGEHAGVAAASPQDDGQYRLTHVTALPGLLAEIDAQGSARA